MSDNTESLVVTPDYKRMFEEFLPQIKVELTFLVEAIGDQTPETEASVILLDRLQSLLQAIRMSALCATNVDAINQLRDAISDATKHVTQLVQEGRR